MTVTKSKGGWLFLTVGFVSCCLLAAVGGANSLNPVYALLLALVAFAFYVGIFELAAIVKATNRIPVIALAGVGMIGCFVVLMAATDAVITGHFSLIPSRMKTAWLLPAGVAFWTLREIWQRRHAASSASET